MQTQMMESGSCVDQDWEINQFLYRFDYNQQPLMQNEYIDLPINIQDTPEYLLEKAEPYKVLPDSNEAANDILKNLEGLIKSPHQDLHLFYETAFPAVLKTHFSGESSWPSPSSLQELFDTEFKPGAQIIYQEFSFRSSMNSIKTAKEEEYFDWIDLSWETYSSIFELEWTRINFSPGMIWDFFDNFLHIYTHHQPKISTLSSKQGFSQEWFNPESTKKILNNIASSIPNIIPTNPSTKQIFAYYSLVAHSVILTHEKKYEEAINIVKRLSLKEMSILSKACGSLLTLFLNVSVSHFLLEEYNKSVKLLETITSFYQKNRKYFSKSQISSDNLQRLYEKSIALLCINYIFLEEKPKSSTLENFKSLSIKTRDSKDKISDSFSKMKQQDISTFLRLFNFVIADYQIADITAVVSERFKKLESVTLNAIIQNYKRIELDKMSRMLRISEKQIMERLKNFGAVQESQSAWDLTIMNPLLKQKKKINVEIEGNVAIFDSQTSDQSESSREWERYREEFTWLSEKVRNI